MSYLETKILVDETMKDIINPLKDLKPTFIFVVKTTLQIECNFVIAEKVITETTIDLAIAQKIKNERANSFAKLGFETPFSNVPNDFYIRLISRTITNSLYTATIEIIVATNYENYN